MNFATRIARGGEHKKKVSENIAILSAKLRKQFQVVDVHNNMLLLVLLLSTESIISVLNQSNSIYLVKSFLSVTRNLFLKSFTMRV